MTGPEHYARAEQLLREVRDGHQEGTDVAAILAAAQTHATLAHAAAAALPATRMLLVAEYKAWAAVAATKVEEELT
jgi:hypothetical protein